MVEAPYGAIIFGGASLKHKPKPVPVPVPDPEPVPDPVPDPDPIPDPVPVPDPEPIFDEVRWIRIDGYYLWADDAGRLRVTIVEPRRQADGTILET